VLLVLLAGMWYWQSQASRASKPEVDYSMFYQWVTEGKIESVVVQGQRVDGTLRAAETVSGESTTDFRSLMPTSDPELLPLLREQKVRIRVDTEQQPVAVQLLVSVFPWILIIGVWVWMSRRARNLMASGGRSAAYSPGFSGADLANLVNEAALAATRRGAGALAGEDFSTAYDKIVLGDLRDGKLNWEEEKKRVAVHEAGHAVVAQFSPGAEPLHRVSILPRGIALGVTQQTPVPDRHLMTQPQIESRLSAPMGGYAAERLALGDVSTGAENDLKEATEVASKMVAHYGMSEAIGPAYYEHQAEHPFLGQHLATDGAVSDATTQTIETETRAFLAKAHQGALQLIQGHRADFDRLVAALLEHETIERAGLRELFGPTEAIREADTTAGSASV